MTRVWRACFRSDGERREIMSARLTSDGSVIVALQHMDRAAASTEIGRWIGDDEPIGAMRERRFTLHPARDKPGTHFTATMIVDGKRLTSKLLCRDALPDVRASIFTYLLPEQTDRYAPTGSAATILPLGDYRSSDAVSPIVSLVVTGAGRALPSIAGHQARIMDIGAFRLCLYVTYLDLPPSANGPCVVPSTFAPQVDRKANWSTGLTDSPSVDVAFMPETLLRQAEEVAAAAVCAGIRDDGWPPEAAMLPLWFYPTANDVWLDRQRRPCARFAGHLPVGRRAPLEITYAI